LRITKRIAAAMGMLLIVVAALTVPAGAALAGSPGVATTIGSSGTTSPRTGGFTPSGSGDVTDEEFPGEEDGAEAPGGGDGFTGTIVDRSLSHGNGHGVSVNSGTKAKSDPAFRNGFEGLNLFQQRYARGGNQFTVEPPDQGLCVGNGYVVEAVNDVLNVYDGTGHSLLPDNTATNIVSGFPTDVDHAVDLNSFFGYAPAINRTTGVRAQFVTDPSCLYDGATHRFFVAVLTLETLPTGAFTGVNHIDIAVSQTSNPAGSWTIYRLPVQDDGTQGTPDHGCARNNDGTGHGPCLGDYPHIGADAHGFYVTTNEYAFFPNFVYMGAQIYAFSKAALASGAPNVAVVQFDTAHAGIGGKPGFTVWPAQSSPNQFATGNGGTEYFMSSDAGDEAQCDSGTVCTPGTATSTDILVWSLTNTSSLDSATPALSLSNRSVAVNRYAVPPRSKQPGSGTAPTTDAPQGFCINDTTTPTIAGIGCWRLLFAAEPAHDEVISRPDSNDSRMQQVTYANGRLWGALDTALNPDGGPQRAGIAWYIVNPGSNKVALQGYLGATGNDFTYPAIGVTASGRGVMAFTATGDSLNPSSAYASIDAIGGVGAWTIVPGGEGAAQDDGFTSYKSQVGNPPRTRWGDYGAAAVDGNTIWIASEYIAHACDYVTWGGRFFGASTGDNKLGTCAPSPGAAGTRAALGNWSTRISRLTP
jgi:hypothetical protein